MPLRNTCFRLGVLEARMVPAVPIVSIVATDSVASEEGPDAAQFTFTRSGGRMNRPLKVSYFVGAEGTASSSDHVPLTGAMVIPAGKKSATIGVMPVDDAEHEQTETMTLVLRTLPSYLADRRAFSARMTIEDNDSEVKPVLLVIANRDFYYQEYSDTRAALEAAGVPVVVAGADVVASYPHANSGQGTGTGMVMPDIDIEAAQASDYSAIVFVGGWGSSSYQYSFAGTYGNGNYNGTLSVEAATNELIGDFVEQDKYVAGLCHGVSVLAWARVDGASPIAGKTVSSHAGGAPAFMNPDGSGATQTQQTTRWHIETNGATMVPSRSIGNPNTATDDVMVDGKIITAENWDSAALFGQTVAYAVLEN